MSNIINGFKVALKGRWERPAPVGPATSKGARDRRGFPAHQDPPVSKGRGENLAPAGPQGVAGRGGRYQQLTGTFDAYYYGSLSGWFG